MGWPLVTSIITGVVALARAIFGSSTQPLTPKAPVTEDELWPSKPSDEEPASGPPKGSN